MSGRLQASGAGDRSSVLVSPDTLKTVTVIFSGTLSLLTNHSASAQDFKICAAYGFPFLAFSSTSWNESNINKVWDNAITAIGARESSFSDDTKGAMLYPPCIVPSISTAFLRSINGLETFPSSKDANQVALTYAASSTPGGTLFSNRSNKNSA